MNQELGEFFVKFTTQGLAEVKDAIDGLTKRLDEAGVAGERASGKQEGFFKNTTLWIGKLAGLTSAVIALKKAWDAVGNAAASTMSIYQQAMLAGTSPQTLERWQWVARHQGLDPNAIIGDFRGGKELLQRFADLEIGEEFNKVFGRAGLGTDAIMASLQAGNLDAVLEMLNKALSARDANGNALINSARAKEILDQLGFSDTMQILLRQQELPTLLQNAKLIYTENPETLSASMRYTDAKATLKDSWNQIWADPAVIKAAADMLVFLNDTVLPALKSFFVWLLDKIGTILSTAGNTEEEKKTGNALKALAAGTVGVATAVATGGLAVPLLAAGGAAYGAGVAHEELLKKSWYRDWIAKGAEANAKWENVVPGTPEFQNLLLSDLGFGANAQPNIAVNGGEATAIVNIDGIETVRRTGSGYTEVSMSLPEQVPLSTR